MRILTAGMKILLRTLTAARCRRSLAFCMVPISQAGPKQGGRAVSISRAYAAENSSDSGFSGSD